MRTADLCPHQPPTVAVPDFIGVGAKIRQRRKRGVSGRGGVQAEEISHSEAPRRQTTGTSNNKHNNHGYTFTEPVSGQGEFQPPFFAEYSPRVQKVNSSCTVRLLFFDNPSPEERLVIHL
ncbi:hypothetical protein BaRGS_00018566 [Batillaria attramentaria]|uniref:Uncharacterized protein n=1 Tax=Batillaria attramentaria TaxID=370345 RepID=A0ABD0KT59_9CAEN